MLRTVILSAILLPTSLLLNAAPLVESRCDALLTIVDIQNKVQGNTDHLLTKASNVVVESNAQCSRLFAREKFDRFSDELIFMMTTASSAESARQTLASLKQDARGKFGFSTPQIGDGAIHYRAIDPLNDSRMFFNVVFVSGAKLIELKYASVDDGKQNKFVIESRELIELATIIQSRL